MVLVGLIEQDSKMAYKTHFALHQMYIILLLDFLAPYCGKLAPPKTYLRMSYPLTPSLKTIDESYVKKEGIMSILGSDGGEATKCPTLRRTLSADMSSKTWLARHSLKRVASLRELPILDSCNEDDHDVGQNKGQAEEIWNLIQEQEKMKKIENLGQFDIWASLQSRPEDKQGDLSSESIVAEPYIHPLVKRASSLSLKSLEICTESLGSETGSDGFSPPPSSEDNSSDDGDHDEVRQQQQQLEEKEEIYVAARYNKKTLPKTFPPPLPSLVRGDGPSLRMQSHRKDGRFVLEAVSVPTQNYFNAQRQDGRLLLTFATNSPTSTEDKPNKYEESCAEVLQSSADVQSEEQDPDDENEAELDVEVTINQTAKPNQSTQMLTNKLVMRIANKNPTSWSKRINKVIRFGKDPEHEPELEHQAPLSKSFPIPPRTAALPPRIPQPPPSTIGFSGTCNVYEACWRKKEPSQTIFSLPPLQKSPPFKNNKFGFPNNNTTTITTTYKKGSDQQRPQRMQALRGGDIKGCKDPRRSLLFWEPHCIATS